MLNTISKLFDIQLHDGLVENTVVVAQSGQGMSIVPPCPECGGTLLMPNRMGMAYHDCKCDDCGNTFNLGKLIFAGTDISQIAKAYSESKEDAELLVANANIKFFKPHG